MVAPTRIPASRRASCSVCAKDIWRSKTSAAVQTCRDCRRVETRPYGSKVGHGESSRYDYGCRCSKCRGAAAERNRGYAKRYKELNGSSLRDRFPDGSVRHWISTERRNAIYERDEWVCWICNERVVRDGDPNADHAPSLDHVRPRALGGTHADENLRCAHRVCNARRGVGSRDVAA